MPKIRQNESALHDWVHALTFQMQALLMTGMRGPDGASKYNPAKAIVRYLRGAVCKPAGNWDGLNDNDFMWGDYLLFKTHAREFFSDPDGYPHHFIMHLIHCAEVIGYKHPDGAVAVFWKDFYLRACKAFHMAHETVEEMDARLNDFGVAVPEADTGRKIDMLPYLGYGQVNQSPEAIDAKVGDMPQAFIDGQIARDLPEYLRDGRDKGRFAWEQGYRAAFAAMPQTENPQASYWWEKARELLVERNDFKAQLAAKEKELQDYRKALEAIKNLEVYKIGSAEIIAENALNKYPTP